MFRSLPWALSFALVLAVSSPAFAGDTDADKTPCEVRVIEGGVECVDTDGNTAWDVIHPSMFGQLSAYIEGGAAEKPVGPIEFDESLFYAWRADLFELDGDVGEIVDRVRFPAPIADVEPAGDELQVVVEDTKFGAEIGEKVAIPHTPGEPSPPQHTWSIEDGADFLQSEWDAVWRTEKADSPRKGVESLTQARSTDPTNPFLSLELGKLFEQLGEDENARRAFERAVEAPNPIWRDMLAVSSGLEEAGAPDQADAAFERGLELMRRAGISEERLVSLAPLVSTLMMPTGDESPIHRALMSADPEEVDRLLSRYAHLAPYIESGDFAWEAVADWMANRGEEGLAEKWQRLADENREYAHGLFARAVESLDRAILAMFSTGVALVVLVFLVGLRGGVRRRRIDDRSGEESSGGWLPSLRIRDLIAPVIFAVALVAFPFYVNTHVEVVGKLADAPLASMQDGLASPKLLEWLDGLSESPEVDRVISAGMRELTALETGDEIEKKEPIVHHLVGALYADARQNQIDLVRSGKMPDFRGMMQAAPGGGPPPDPEPMNLGLVVVPLMGLVLVLLIGSFIGASAPKVAQPILLVVPGGTRRLAPVGAVALAGLIAAVGAFAGLDSLLFEMAKPAHLQYFGLQSLDELAPRPSRVWAAVTVGLVVVFQAAMFVWERADNAKS